MAVEKGDRVRVKSAFFIRGNGRRMLRGQVFTVADDDNTSRSDIDYLLEAVDEAAEAADVEAPVSESDEADDSQWSDDLDLDALTEQLLEMNVEQSRRFLSRPEWTIEGMRKAQQAEEAGDGRITILRFIEGRIDDLVDESEDAELLGSDS